MTKEEKYSLAKWAVDFALKNDAQQASVNISDSRSSSVEIRESKIDTLEQAIQNNLTIKLYVNKKYSVHSTNRLKKDELTRFISEAISATKYLAEDEFRSLPDPELYYNGNGTNLITLDSDFDTIDPKNKIQLAFKTEEEVLGKDERIISATTSYNDGLNERVMVTSNGFEGDQASSYYTLYATVSVKSENARPESYWYENNIFFDKLIKEGIGSEALKRALNKIGQKKVGSGKMPMIVENRQVARLLGPVISALNGSSIQQKKSFLVDKLGQRVFSEKLSIIDDPFILTGRGSKLFDNEGLATKKRSVFKNGILSNYFINTYYAKKLEMKPTSGDTTNITFKTSDKNLQALIETVEKGILVTGFNGGNCNGATGDYSYGIEGFLIERGKLAQPVSEMNITGNMIDLWSGIGEIGNDINTSSSMRLPSVLFDGVDFSGA